MSSLTHSPLMPAAKAHGRAASLKQVLREQLTDGLTRLWTALETTGRLRAAPVLLQQADRLQASDPALAAALRSVARPSPTTPSRAAGAPSAVR